MFVCLTPFVSRLSNKGQIDERSEYISIFLPVDRGASYYTCSVIFGPSFCLVLDEKLQEINTMTEAIDSVIRHCVLM